MFNLCYISPCCLMVVLNCCFSCGFYKGSKCFSIFFSIIGPALYDILNCKFILQLRILTLTEQLDRDNLIDKPKYVDFWHLFNQILKQDTKQNHPKCYLIVTRPLLQKKKTNLLIVTNFRPYIML